MRFNKLLLILGALFSSGCLQPLTPDDSSRSAIGFRQDRGGDGWAIESSEYRVDGTKVPWGNWQKLEVSPGRRLISFAWDIQSEGDESDHGLTLLTTKSGTCDVWIDAAPGHGYLVGAEVQSGGSWVSDPEIKAIVLDGTTYRKILSVPCSYRHRGLMPGVQ